MHIAKQFLIGLSALLLTACGGGGTTSVAPASNSGPTGAAPVTKVTVSGKITYDLVPHKIRGFGLDYDATVKSPARGITVVILDEKNDVLDQTITNSAGQYSFSVGTSKDVKIQARAQLLASDNKAWNVTVTDNTLDNALYVMEGSLNSSGTKATQTRNLHAPSGWQETGYKSNRVAAPFAILGPVFDGISAVDAVDRSVVFPDLEIRWSPENRSVTGDLALGQIGTSGYYRGENAIYLLGEAGRDTDEYDPHVIIHEWGHYFEHNLSRMDSIGGLHSLSDKLDPRLAFSEGFGNALSAMITRDPEYKDSLGAEQNGGFGLDFENVTSSRAGWFNEGSVAAILYDIFDEAQDGADRMNLGIGPIYTAMIDPAYKQSDVFTTIYAFSDAILSQAEVNGVDYELLLESQSIMSSDAYGTGESNNGAIASALPVYKEMSVGSAPVQVCSVDDAGNYNKLGNREFVFFNLAADGEYTITMTQVSGEGERDPDFNIWLKGNLNIEANSSVDLEEQYSGLLSVGNYVLEAYDFHNINGGSSRRGDSCFEIKLTAI